MERKREDRSFWVLLLLSTVTCGLYGIYFWVMLVKDLNAVCRPKEENDDNMSFHYILVTLLSFVTCGIYYWIWLYKQGNRMQRIGNAYGEHIEENGTSFLMWSLFGALICGIGPFVVIYLFIKNVNTLCRCYNKEYVDGNSGGSAYGGGSYAGSSNAGGSYGGAYDGGSDRGGYTPSGESAYSSVDSQNTADDVNTQPPTIPLRPGTLTCTKGTLKGADIPIQDGEVIIVGRDGSSCNLILTDMDISRKHCAIQYNKGSYWITDYSSTGVRINRTQALEKNQMTRCEKGTVILLGNGSNEFLLQ